ncbi:MAG: hypothetical protein ACYTAF_11505 [Planctomycetota bacterium]|jgi:hypothetical protein
MRWLPLLLLLCLPALSVAQESVAEKEIENKISGVRISVDFRDTPLSEVIDYVREITDINILIDGGKVDTEMPVTITVTELQVKSLLELMLSPSDYGWTYQDDVLLITDRESLGKKVILELYDIRDILFPLRDFPGVDISLRDERIWGSVFAPPDVVESEPPPVEELIREHTGGNSWYDNENADIKLHNGILVVKTTKKVHREITRLLGLLRQYK